MKLIGSLGLVGIACLVGCTGGESAKAPPTTSAPPSGAGYYAHSAPASAEATAMAPPATSTPTQGASPDSAPSGASASRDEERAPSQRPGLGTEWGETRYSHVEDVPFVRADDERPFAIASLRYDDRAGVDALAAYHARMERWTSDVPAAGGALVVSIRGANGAPLEARRVGDRTYVVGHAGDRYAIVLSNHTGHRVEAVATVDGLDVINGQSGTMSNRGYLLGPYASMQIDGFRQSADAVAAFRFGRVADSYAAKTGSARDVGVIGVAFFDERGDRVRDLDEVRTREDANPFPADDRYARPPQ